MERDGSVRAIGRGLAVLKAINQHVSLDMTSIAKATALPYPTACRIVDTLIEEGMVEREPSRKHYRATSLVRTLSHGYRPEDELVAAASPTIHEMTREYLWPVIVCSRVGSTMMIHESSHRISPKTLSMYYPGYTMPILGCSAGLVYLASCGEDERKAVLDGLEQSNDLAGAYSRQALLRTFEEFRRQGFGHTDRCQNNANPGKTSSIAAPIMVGGICKGTLTLTVFASVMTVPEAIERFAGPLQRAARVVSEALALDTLRGSTPDGRAALGSAERCGTAGSGLRGH